MRLFVDGETIKNVLSIGSDTDFLMFKKSNLKMQTTSFLSFFFFLLFLNWPWRQSKPREWTTVHSLRNKIQISSSSIQIPAYCGSNWPSLNFLHRMLPLALPAPHPALHPVCRLPTVRFHRALTCPWGALPSGWMKKC